MKDFRDTEKYFHDEDGIWQIEEWGKSLIEPTQKWFDENKMTNPIPEPTQEERILALEQALLNLLG